MYTRGLVATAAAYAVLHHLGLVPDGLGEGPDGTRWTDWLDLALPWLVLGPAAATLVAAHASQRSWVLLGAGVVAYASGHGIHLAANSVGNADPGVTAHLWDEVVGHYVWYAGAALVLAALALTMADRPRPHPLGHLLAAAVGVTWATNAIGGGTVVLGLIVAVAAVAFGWVHRGSLAGALFIGFVPAVGVLLVQLAVP